MLQKSNLAKNPCISRVFCYFRSKNDVCKTVQLFWSLYDLNSRQLSRKYGQITVNHTHYTEWLLIRRNTAEKTIWHWPLSVYSHPPFSAIFFNSEVISLNKYEPLWRFLSGDGSGCIQFSFERIEEILGFSLDIFSSVTNRKLNNTDTVSRKFRSKKNGCVLSASPHSDIIPLQILVLSYII